MFRFTLIFVTLYAVEPAKILGIFPIPSKSHFNLGFRLMEELARRGHQVTVLSPFPQYNKIGNYSDILVQNTNPVLQNPQCSPVGDYTKQLLCRSAEPRYIKTLGHVNNIFERDIVRDEMHPKYITSLGAVTATPKFLNGNIWQVILHLKDFRKSFIERENMNFVTSTCFLYNMAHDLTEAFLSDENVQTLLKSNQEYDLVVTEYFMNEAIIGIGRVFTAPTILVSPLPSSTLNNHLFSNPLPSSFVPNILTEFTGTMSYWERFSNLFYNVLNNNYRFFVMMPKQNRLLKKYVDENFEIGEITKDVDLILLNSHPSVTEPVPLSPNMIEIGGFHIDSSKTGLSWDLEKFMNSSNNGVVLFSMGSNLKSVDLGHEAIEALVKAFSRIQQNVLWKFEEYIPDLPANVKLVTWFPQQKILDHPNTKTFISHGGLLSSIETVYYGVPLIGIPIYGDQKSNTARAVRNGYAISIPFKEISEDKLVWAMKKIVEDTKYKENAQKRSNLLREQPIQPLDKAIYWIEFVIKHNGSKFLQSPGVKLHGYQKHMIDIIIVLVIIDIILFLIFYYIIKHIIRHIRVAIQKRRINNYNKLEKM